MKKKIFLVGIFLTFLLVGCGKEKIDVTESLTVKFDGANGYGTAEIENAYGWEKEAFEKAGIEKIDSLSTFGDGLTIESAVSYDIFPKENLSNGDEVVVKAVCNNEAVEEYDIKFTSKERKFVVAGLPEVQQVDLFENVDILFKGIAPDVTATVSDENTDYYVWTNYTIDKYNNLNVGDTIIMTAKYDKEKLLENGYIAESDTKEFTVPNVDKYVTELSEIPTSIMDKMKKQMEDALRAYVASKWIESESMVGMNYCGNYLLTLKSGMNSNIHNAVYLIYKIDVENSEDKFSYYTYCRFENLIILEDGTCSVDLSRYTMPSGSAFFNNAAGEAFCKGQYYYLGYEQIDSLFNKCVTANIENYEYESNVVEE